MKLQELQILADEDLRINKSNLDVESLRTPELHNKWMKFLNAERLAFNMLSEKSNEIYKEKWEYYSGKSDAAVYKEKPFALKILRQDINIYINSDKEYMEFNLKLKLSEEKVDFCLQTLKQITSRNWHISNAIKWKMFQNGIDSL